MVLPTDFKVFWAVQCMGISCTACAASNFACLFETSRFAEAIPRDGTESDRDLLGSGSPSTDLKNHRRAVVLTDSVQTVADCNNYSLLLISVVNNFRVLNFHG